jgi:hypothetical protein
MRKIRREVTRKVILAACGAAGRMPSATQSAKPSFPSRAHDALIRVYDSAGNVIDTHEHKGGFKEP